MPRFHVKIHAEGKELERARVALAGANIKTTGPNRLFRWLRLGRQLTAVVDAPTSEAAVYRVSENLPEVGDYTLAAKLWPPA